MIISIWRYSHLALAISSFLLLTAASITGIFLAAEPVLEKAQPFKIVGLDSITLQQVIPILKEKHPGIQEISIDDHDFVRIKYPLESGGDQQAFVNPITGQILGRPQEKSAFFQWMTNMHRSLFLHETGRILVGVSAFLLILIAVSGMMLVAQRQNGWKNFFSNIEKTSFVQYNHVLFGRLALFFILALAITGTYLAVYRFVTPPPKASSKINESSIQETPALALDHFPIFKKIKLSELQKLQYPFSDFPEDYYNLQLKDREICVNQFTGDILAQQSYTTYYQLANFSLRWHTGRSGSIWSIIMAITCGYILFFIYSGFAITLKRRRARSKNHVQASEAEWILLVGSENGATFKFADAVFTQLIKHGHRAYITDISNYQSYPKASQLIIMTSTYGQGEVPSNAKRFFERIQQYPQQQSIAYSIVGFGSRSYVHFCKAAYDMDLILQQQNWAKPLMPLHTVNEKSPQDFSDWLTNWNKETGNVIQMPRTLLAPPQHLSKIQVQSKTAMDAENAFTITLKSTKFKQALSGDLLAIYPRQDHRMRLYSIGKIDGAIQLSVKWHPQGLGSSYLQSLQPGDWISAQLVKNQHFRFPKTATQIIMISNGTGIAPFLGMIHENKKNIPVQLYCGFRKQSSFSLYQPYLLKQIEGGKLSTIHLSLSNEEMEYVSHRLLKNQSNIWDVLVQGGTIMICGSLSMQRDVMQVLAEICLKNQDNPLDFFIEKGQILTDCY